MAKGKSKTRDIVDRLRSAADAAESSQQARLLRASANAIEELRRDCAEAYLAVGHIGLSKEPFADKDVLRLLDNLSCAANGWPRKHDDLLPWPKPVRQRKTAGRAAPSRRPRT